MLFCLSKTKKIRSEINLVIKNIKEALQEKNIEQDIIDLLALESLYLLLYHANNTLNYKQSKKLFDSYSTDLLFETLLHKRLLLYKDIENKSTSPKSVWLLKDFDLLEPIYLAFGDLFFFAWENNDLARHYQDISLTKTIGETYFEKFIIFSKVILPLILKGIRRF